MNDITLTINLKFDSKIPTQPLHAPFMDDDEWLAHYHKEFHDACIEQTETIKNIKGNNKLDAQDVKCI